MMSEIIKREDSSEKSKEEEKEIKAKDTGLKLNISPMSIQSTAGLESTSVISSARFHSQKMAQLAYRLADQSLLESSSPPVPK